MKSPLNYKVCNADLLALGMVAQLEPSCADVLQLFLWKWASVQEQITYHQKDIAQVCLSSS